ncbi:hypothetical protein E3N88_12071 [Mikania micrantha]|uniref:FAR1 domain-containing protein n=1 Tax=Mikania micrantha TaxID=192012 RepID=A0A5N6P4S9_9ASTR|nr:hypothetical protein E3N88_12071 [Mikania micrantha]
MEDIFDISMFDSLVSREDDEGFISSDLQVLPSSGVLDDVCDVFDDCDVYIPLPLSYEEPGQAQDAPMPLNKIMGDVVDVSDVFEPLSICNDLSTVEKGKAAINISGEENVQRSYTFLTPNSTKVWCPISGNDSRPHVGATYGSWHDVITMYKNYAMNCGFSVHVGQTKRNKDDVITHKYLRCNKSGRPQSKRKFDTLAESSLHFRKSSYQVTDCKAHIGVQVTEAMSTFYLYKFVECHNHPLVEPYNRDLTKAGRKLSFSTKQFIHHMTLNRIGPTISHRLQVSMKGGHHNVKRTPTDFKNFSQAIRLFIGNRDSQLFLDRLRDRVQNITDFYFDFCDVNGELRHAFWVDEISKRNYECFGDVLAFDATSCIHCLVWNLYISPATFEERWGELICKFHLGDHVWLSDMYAIRSQWVPAYFRELPMCCLMKTTSRCESSNASFKVNSSGSNTLVQFVLCYDTSIESQRYRQRLAEHKTSCRPFQSLTDVERRFRDGEESNLYNPSTAKLNGDLGMAISNGREEETHQWRFWRDMNVKKEKKTKMGFFFDLTVVKFSRTKAGIKIRETKVAKVTKTKSTPNGNAQHTTMCILE